MEEITVWFQGPNEDLLKGHNKVPDSADFVALQLSRGYWEVCCDAISVEDVTYVPVHRIWYWVV